MKLSDLLDYIQPTKYIVSNEFYNDSYKIPVLTAGKTFILGYTNDTDGIFEASKAPVILFDDFTTSFKWVDFDFKVKSSACKILVPKKGVDLRYVYYAMQHICFDASQHMRYWISKYSQIDIKYPSKVERDAAVRTLDLIKGTIDKDRELLTLLKKIVNSRFNEMFNNVSHYVSVGDSCEVHARIGWQALTQKEHMSQGEYMLITGTDFVDNEINYSTCVYVSKERFEMDEHIILKNDDVLITKDGTIGKVAIVHNLPCPATLNSGVFVVRPDERFNKEYISYVFKGEPFMRFVEEVKTGVTVNHLNQGALLKFMIPVPSFDKQKEFADFLSLIENVKTNINNRIKLFDELVPFSF